MLRQNGVQEFAEKCAFQNRNELNEALVEAILRLNERQLAYVFSRLGELKDVIE